ncbi:hypothetical protein Nhal_1694 [Nitrosococcus halophilus Nc 4]|uniref:Uncharacterized protein n=1 Tax=Nitrosococcus halophilus (strain Nc4) TaxID=472759 RepID=D5C2G3_NITHN|nr:hypothetical protein Nhal_1694 [Nitrosococcus halophilus Nc 4]
MKCLPEGICLQKTDCWRVFLKRIGKKITPALETTSDGPQRKQGETDLYFCLGL